MAGDKFLNAAGLSKAGNDTIFGWWARFQEAKSAGLPAVNGTIGALLEDDGQLAINKAVDAAIRQAPEQEIAAYAPLAGLPSFLDLSKSLAFGDAREELAALGFHFSSTASPGGSGAYGFAKAAKWTCSAEDTARRRFIGEWSKVFDLLVSYGR